MRSTRLHAAALLAGLTALVLAGCGAGDRAGGVAEVRDSAGITIVENSAARWLDGEGWRLSPEPSVDIGVVEGAPEYQLFRAWDAARMSDGRIVVANRGTQELRVYDADGTYRRSIGGEGQGPGEFRGVSWVEVAEGDTILAFDTRLRRLSVFGPGGEFVRSAMLRQPDESGFPRPVGHTADGSLIVSAGRVFGPGGVEDGASRDPVTYMRYTMDGELRDTIARLPGQESFVQTMDRGFTVTSLAFGRSPRAAVHRDRIYYGASDTYEIAVYTASGEIERLIRKAHENLPVTADDIERYRQRQLENASNDDWRTRLERMIAEMPIPETMPAYSNVEVDAAGNLWVAHYRRPGDDQPRWDVFDPDGRWLGVVETPPRFTVNEIGADYVLGRWVDEFDVEHIRLYELTKTGFSEVAAR